MPCEPAALMTDTQAAAMLGVSRATLWRRAGDGALPKPIKIGGSTRWRREELVAAIERAVEQRDRAQAA